MSKILFVNGNLHGHFNPTLPVVRELISRGEEVWYFASDKFKEELETVGAHFISTGAEIDKFNQGFAPSGNHPFYTLLEYKVKYDKAMIPVLLEQIKGLVFDILVFDSYFGAGSFLPGILKLTSVCSTTTFAIPKLPLTDDQLLRGCHPQLDEFYRVLEEQCSYWKVPVPDAAQYFLVKGDVTLVYTAREFNPGGASFDNTYAFVGPSISNRVFANEFPWHKLGGDKLIFISMGTINTALADFYKMCIEAFRESGYQIVMSIGNKTEISSLGTIPDNFILSRQVPQLEILKRTALFISHGGLNSINEAIYYGVPCIVLPLANDQYITAAQVAKMKIGIPLAFQEVSAATLKSTTDEIISTSSYQENIQKLRDVFQNAGGYSKAADVIQQTGGTYHGNKK
ncbi:macrolide family glycosyltransferase [Anaerocolumna xylanovorans]|uniref:Glycosyltransferase, MGT family n=1 Tax=Anaerocolumna xylanovorans DSM 12503 TaxID=1121345 RepID=A0A1M7Y1T1_9FIRM|nr:macrolide family glycosyltransferase [Anaerocolumna xylanovorans]SHO45758.1 glycosyltransferase, MGT family [Anaerocolumna xylanovorans DSM 12503]